MAKVKLGNIAPRAFPETRGRVMLSDTKHGAVMSKWPRKRGKAKSGYDLYRQLEFGKIAKWCANPLDLDLGTAIEMAKGTEQVPRDIMMMAAIGGYYEIVSPEGLVWEQARMTTNAQYILDQVTFDPGSLLWRAPVGWLGLPAGLPGQVLVSDGNQPFWGAGSGGGAGVVCTANTWQGTSSSNYASKGVLWEPLAPFTVLSAYGRFTAVSGASYRWGVYAVNASYTITAVVSQTPLYVAPSAGQRAVILDFPAPVTLAQGQRYALLFTRTDSTNTTPSGLHAGSGDGRNIPINQTNRYLAYARNNPGIGHSPNADGPNPYAYGVKALLG